MCVSGLLRTNSQTTHSAEACVAQVAELNPYVRVETSSVPLHPGCDMSFLSQYHVSNHHHRHHSHLQQCVILLDAPIELQKEVDAYCRTHTSPQPHKKDGDTHTPTATHISFISSEVHGVYGSVFVDHGERFEVIDATGEELRDVYIANITNDSDGIVTVIENHMHGLEDNDTVTFREVVGMSEINGKTFTVKTINQSSFKVGMEEYGMTVE